MTDYLVQFVIHGDPNGAGGNLINWPRYDNQTRQQLTFVGDIGAPLVIESDTYRVDGFDKLTELSLRFPLWQPCRWMCLSRFAIRVLRGPMLCSMTEWNGLYCPSVPDAHAPC